MVYCDVFLPEYSGFTQLPDWSLKPKDLGVTLFHFRNDGSLFISFRVFCILFSDEIRSVASSVVFSFLFYFLCNAA